MSEPSTQPTPEDVAEANAIDLEALLLPILSILGSITHRNLSSSSRANFLVPRDYVVALKNELDRQIPGLYDQMRQFQQDRRENKPAPKCPTCNSRCDFYGGAWVCSSGTCGATWSPDHGPEFAAPQE